MSIANTISGWPSRVYHGVAPVVAGVVVAYVLTGLLWPSLGRPQVYNDVVVGNITWLDIDKDRDFRALHLTVAVAAAAAVGVGALLRGLSREGVSGDVGQALNALLAFAMLPACWRLGRALTVPDHRFQPWDSVVLLLAVLAIVVGLYRYRRDLTGPLTMQIAGGSLLALVLGFLSGLGIALFVGRFFPTAAVAMTGKAGLFGGLASLVAALGLVDAFATSRDPHSLSRRIDRVLLLVQVPLPLLGFVMIPPPWVEGGRAIRAPYSITLPLVLGVLMAYSLASLWRRHRAWARGDVAGGCGMGGVLEPSCLAAIAAYLVVPTVGIPVLSGDLFHSGEQLLPWQQLVALGKRPYVDFIPIHGLMAIIKGFFNYQFFDGTAAGFTTTMPLMMGVWAIATFLSASALAGPLVALFIACLLVAFPCHDLDRVYFLMPALFVLVNGRLLTRPSRWLLVWPLVSAFLIAYSASLGPALLIATLPIASTMAYRVFRDDRPAFGRLVAILSGSLVAILCVPALREMAFGLFRYVWENYDSNNVAYGIAWEQSLGRPVPDSGLAITRFGWELIRCSWMLVVFGVGFLGLREMAKPRHERRPEVVALGVAGPTVLLLAAQYAFGRIDMEHMSRTGALSFIALAHLLPVALLLGRPATRSLAVVVPIVLLLGAITPARSPSGPYRYHRAGLLAKPTETSALPEGLTLVVGQEIGLPSLGRLEAEPDLLGGIRELKAALSVLLKPGETYLDLTNTSAYYYYLGLPVPVLYASNYTAPAGAMQNRMLDRLDDALPPVVLIAPVITHDGGPASLRSYRLYRECVLRYTAVRHGRFTFLVDPSRVPDASSRGGDEQCALLEPIAASMLAKIPASWGRSWKSLAPRFREVASLGRNRLEGVNHVTEKKRGVFVPDGVDPFLVYRLGDLGLAGADVDFLKLTVRRERAPGTPDPVFSVRWVSEGHEISPPIVFTATNSSLLVPLGANPRWLLSDRLTTLRIDLENPESCRRIALNDIKLLRLAPGR